MRQRATLTVAPSAVPPIMHEVLRSPGRRLDAKTRAFIAATLDMTIGVSGHVKYRGVEYTR